MDSELTVRCVVHDAALGQLCISEDGAVIGVCPARRKALADLERQADELLAAAEDVQQHG